MNAVPKPWTTYPKGVRFTLACMTNDGQGSTVSIRVACLTAKPAPKATPVAALPSPSGMPVEDMPQPEQMPKPKRSPQPRPAGPEVMGKKGCIDIDARKTKLSSGWTVEKDGITFLKGDNRQSIVRAGQNPVSYMFTAPVTSEYAFILDMTTRGGTEHNDVWAKFEDGGFNLLRSGKFRVGISWIKVYHSKNGRAIESKSVDFTPHTISTRRVLQKGKKYKIELSGRSSKLTVHRIIMFPCKGTGTCRASSKEYQAQRAKCT